MQGHSHAVRDAVADAEEPCPQGAEAYLFAGGDDVYGHAVGEPVLLELDRDEAGGQVVGPDGWEAQLGEDVGQGSGVVFVAVGDDDPPDAIDLIQEVGDVRDDEVDAEHLVLGNITPTSMMTMSRSYRAPSC